MNVVQGLLSAVKPLPDGDSADRYYSILYSNVDNHKIVLSQFHHSEFALHIHHGID